MANVTNVDTMTLDGGRVVFDFVNSGYDRLPGVVTERLENYGDLLTLSQRLALFEAGHLNSLRDQAAAHPSNAGKALKRILEARELLYQFFSAIVNGQVVILDQQALTGINALMREALMHRQLVVKDQVPLFIDHSEPEDLLAPLWKVLLDAYDLLANGQSASIRQCAGCAWLFYDQTKNQRKKWCSMASCGNSQKTKRYYAQKKTR